MGIRALVFRPSGGGGGVELQGSELEAVRKAPGVLG